MASAGWTVTRYDHEVRVDVTTAASMDGSDAEAIVRALEGYLDEDGITMVRFDGPVLEERWRQDEVTALVVRVERLAEERDIRFYAGPL